MSSWTQFCWQKRQPRGQPIRVKATEILSETWSRSGGRGLFLRRLLEEAPSAVARPASGHVQFIGQLDYESLFLLPAATEMCTMGRLSTRPSRRRRSVSATHSSWTRLRSSLPLRMSYSAQVQVEIFRSEHQAGALVSGTVSRCRSWVGCCASVYVSAMTSSLTK